MGTRDENLARANEIRRARAKTKREIRKTPEIMLEILRGPIPEHMQSISAADLVCSARGIGRVRGNRLLIIAGVRSNLRLRDLTVRQRTVLAGLVVGKWR